MFGQDEKKTVAVEALTEVVAAEKAAKKTTGTPKMRLQKIEAATDVQRATRPRSPAMGLKKDVHTSGNIISTAIARKLRFDPSPILRQVDGGIGIFLVICSL